MAPYVYDVSREGDSNSVESEKKSFCAAAGIEPATFGVWDEDGTTRPLPVHQREKWGAEKNREREKLRERKRERLIS
jgi:hypothetical protein